MTRHETWIYESIAPLINTLQEHAPNGEWRMKVKCLDSSAEERADLGYIVSESITVIPTGPHQIFSIMTNDDYSVHRITWDSEPNRLEQVNIYPDIRTVELRTDSLIFAEVVRHALLHSNPRKLIIDLKVGS